MISKKLLMIFAALFFLFPCPMETFAQGGWDVWTVYLRDGSRIDAAPVWSLDKNILKYGMSGKVGEGKQLRRSLIKSMTRNVAARSSTTETASPVDAQRDVKKDRIVLTDGRRLSGVVFIRAGKNPSGELKYFSPVLTQNGIEFELTEVDYIQLAKPKRSR